MAIRARCLLSAVQDFVNVNIRSRVEQAIHVEGPLDGVHVGKIYDVVALEERSGGVWLFIHTVEDSEHPYPYPIEMFEIVDSVMPAGWSISFEMQPAGVAIKRLTFPEWAGDATFFERLVDRDPHAVEVYNRERLRLRFANSDVMPRSD